MKYFSARQKQLWPLIKDKKIYLFLDYDGTLAPIAKSPDQALLSPKIRVILKKLARQPRCVLAIISGRSLANIKKMVKIPKIIYAGNHGLEIDHYGIRVKFFRDARFQGLLGKLYRGLRKKLQGLKGVLLENKKMTLAVHYRTVSRHQRPMVKAILREQLKKYQSRRQVNVTTGKMVLEVRPPLPWGKGDVVKWLLPNAGRDRKKTAIFYFGDDRTDEDAFKAVKRRGYAIKVGKKKDSAAEYYLRNTGEVREVLAHIEQSLETGR